ncbi:sodium:glutamate symporter [Candidatus Saccharibacteria bacterium]|nr:sodium:glutamate symporter [Candidatus Saccharibacteria bacterium]
MVTYIVATFFLLSAVVVGYLIARLPLIRRLYIPTALVAGAVLLVLGPQIAGTYFPAYQAPSEYYEVWSSLPQHMIVLVFAGLFLGKPFLSIKKMWKLAGPQVAFGQTVAWGHYAVAGLVTLLILTPIFNMPPFTAALLEMSFEGGHGTVAGMTPVFESLDFETGRQIATGLATASLVSALIIGVILINWARRNGHISSGSPVRIARNKIYYHMIVAELRRKHVSLQDVVTFRSLLAHTVLLFIGVLFGWLIHQGFLLAERLFWAPYGVEFFGFVPLFTFAIFGGMIAQVIWRNLGFTIVREVVELISSFTLTILIVTAIGSMSLEFLVNDGLVFLALYISGVAWLLFAFSVLARRMFRRYWFQNAIISFGQGMGMTATGLLFAQMVDPKNRTNAVEAFGYKQLMFEPIVGGGLVTALSMPIIIYIGLPLFTAICTGIVFFWMIVGFSLYRKTRR